MQRWRLGFGFPAAEENSGSFVNGRRTYTFFFRPSGKHVEASGGCESSLVETLRGVLLASTVGLTLGTTTKLNWARWLPVCGCPHVLLFFHGQRYWLGDYVIMPNHIHCLVAFLDNDIVKTQPGSWMRFSAKKINQLLGSNGALWFPEPFDHFVRSENQLEYLRSYIGDNPKKAGLNKGEFTYRRSVGNF